MKLIDFSALPQRKKSYGGGIKYILPMSIQELLDSGILSIFKWRGI